MGVSFDGSGNVVVTGFFESDTVDFGGDPLTSAGLLDIFIAKFDDPVASAVAPLDTRTLLLQNTPNPFNPATRIQFTLGSAEHVTLSIYDAMGRRVTTLVNDVRSAGPHEAQWDGTDASGASVSSGVYFYRLTAGETSRSRRMVLLKSIPMCHFVCHYGAGLNASTWKNRTHVESSRAAQLTTSYAFVVVTTTW